MYGVYLLKDNPALATDEFRREIELSTSHDAARIQLVLEFLHTADYEQGLKYAKRRLHCHHRASLHTFTKCF